LGQEYSSPGWVRPEKPRYRHHKASRESWKPVQQIPQFEREEIRRRVEEARKALADSRGQIAGAAPLVKAVSIAWRTRSNSPDRAM
jgi:hypothetical protein